jgi:hypothetical protein
MPVQRVEKKIRAKTFFEPQTPLPLCKFPIRLQSKIWLECLAMENAVLGAKTGAKELLYRGNRIGLGRKGLYFFFFEKKNRLGLGPAARRYRFVPPPGELGFVVAPSRTYDPLVSY